MSTSIHKFKEAVISRFQETNNPKLLGLLNEAMPHLISKKWTLTIVSKKFQALDQVLGEKLLELQREARAIAMIGKGKKIVGAENIPPGQEKDWYKTNLIIDGKHVYIYNDDN